MIYTKTWSISVASLSIHTHIDEGSSVFQEMTFKNKIKSHKTAVSSYAIDYHRKKTVSGYCTHSFWSDSNSNIPISKKKYRRTSNEWQKKNYSEITLWRSFFFLLSISNIRCHKSIHSINYTSKYIIASTSILIDDNPKFQSVNNTYGYYEERQNRLGK